ncbi:hypothetical protein [Pseudokineococcus sp. 1T1Z-3]|uniref:hypothetical protein n=1 Tax=Pseudokineococcus sp. 1T1Z-3 TaxID=3132745 RepID=UPI0030B10985
MALDPQDGRACVSGGVGVGLGGVAEEGVVADEGAGLACGQAVGGLVEGLGDELEEGEALPVDVVAMLGGAKDLGPGGRGPGARRGRAR